MLTCRQEIYKGKDRLTVNRTSTAEFSTELQPTIQELQEFEEEAIDQNPEVLLNSILLLYIFEKVVWTKFLHNIF